MATNSQKIIVVLGLFLASVSFGASKTTLPSVSMVPNSETAITIAIAVFKPIYGAENIEKQRPFHAKLIKDTWHVYGSIQTGRLGGIAEAELSRKDGRIIRISHGQ